MSPSYVHDQLRLDTAEDEQSLTIRFTGKSILREPAEFVLPILLAALAEAGSRTKRLVLDFRALSYMNSSTLTPVIKVLERVRLGDGMVTALYRRDLKWQSVSFSALAIFQTPDGRVQINGAE